MIRRYTVRALATVGAVVIGWCAITWARTRYERALDRTPSG